MTDTATALTAILVPPEEQAAAQTETTSARETLDALRAWPCETPRDEADLAEVLQAVKGKWSALEEKRTSITKPLNAAKRAVDALFKPALDAFKEAEAIIKNKLVDAQARRMAANAQAVEAAKAAASHGNAQAAGTALARVELVQSPAGTHYRYHWEVETYDLDQVPREWLSVDWSKVKIYLNAHQASQEIPPVAGFTFRRVPTVVSRSG